MVLVCSKTYYIFAKLKTLANSNPAQADCSLICDAMSIKENIFYNRSTGKYYGYIDYGKDIVIEDEDLLLSKTAIFIATHEKKYY